MIKKKKKGGSVWQVTFPDGTEERVVNLSEFAEKYGLDKAHLSAVARGKRLSHNGFVVRPVSTVQTTLLDKLKSRRNEDFLNLIEALIETTPRDKITPYLAVKVLNKIYDIFETYKKMTEIR